MTDIEALFMYRLQQSEETISDARKMLDAGSSPRSVINRAYYSIFYALLALFLKAGINIKTSKHRGIISIFDKEFVKTGKFDKGFSEMLHATFDARQEGDYKEFVQLSLEDAARYVENASIFLEGVKRFIAL